MSEYSHLFNKELKIIIERCDADKFKNNNDSNMVHGNTRDNKYNCSFEKVLRVVLTRFDEDTNYIADKNNHDSNGFKGFEDI